MILQALVSYYETMAQKGLISRSGWGKTRVQYALEIDEHGTLIAVIPIGGTDDKGKLTPANLELPATVLRTVGILPNFLWDNSAYLTGADGKDKPERALKCFEAAKEFHLLLLSQSDEPFAKAICGFFENWKPEKAQENPIIAEYIDEFAKGANLTFMFGGETPDKNSAFAKIWQEHYDRADDENKMKMRCLVTGEETAPELTHPMIKKVNGAQSSGAALVSFNAPAYCSYGHEQNYNAPVGKYAAFAYTTALNSLTADSTHKKLIGDTTVVYWAETAEPQYQDVFSDMFEGNTMTDNDLKSVMDSLSKGHSVNWGGLPIKPDNSFYVLGLAPNAARLSVRFFLRDTFGDFAKNLKAHYDRLEIVRPEFDKDEEIPLWKLLRETVNQKSKDKSASPQMAGDTLRSILTGTSYPATLFQQTMLRIRAENDINRRKAAIIKAYLLKNTGDNFNKEALTVELNEKTTYQPYILGRMFSVLEAIQEKANPGINATIKDKYFSSAAATPAVVFPTLMNLAEKHLKKMDTGSRIWFSKQLGELSAMVTESYPVHLTLNDQGIFQLGYYHQTQKRYEKKNSINEEEK